MQPIASIIPMVVTQKVAETREFYLRHFDVKLSYDHETYVALKTRTGPHGESEIAFRTPKGGEPCFSGGLSFALQVPDADAELARLKRAGVPVVKDISSNPWGDRSFVVVDPSGVGLYVFHNIEAAPEYRQAAKI